MLLCKIQPGSVHVSAAVGIDQRIGGSAASFRGQGEVIMLMQGIGEAREGYRHVMYLETRQPVGS